jgi:tetratricopeptide (TPR) repeat protein
MVQLRGKSLPRRHSPPEDDVLRRCSQLSGNGPLRMRFPILGILISRKDRLPSQDGPLVWPTLSPAVVDTAPLLVFRITALRQDGDLAWEHVLDRALRKHPDDNKLKAISAEAVLERVLKADPALLGGSGSAFPSQAELIQAAEIFETGWKVSLGRETPPEGSYTHNAALVRKILGQEKAAEELLDAALRSGFEADETKRFRLYLYPQRGAPEEAIRLADSLADSPQSSVIQANFRVDRDPVKAREILAGRDSFTDRRDVIAAALVVIESLIAESKFDEASVEADRLKSLLPGDPPWALAKYRIRSAQGELWSEVGDGVTGKAAYRGGVQRLHFSNEGVIRRVGQ